MPALKTTSPSSSTSAMMASGIKITHGQQRCCARQPQPSCRLQQLLGRPRRTGYRYAGYAGEGLSFDCCSIAAYQSSDEHGGQPAAPASPTCAELHPILARLHGRRQRRGRSPGLMWVTMAALTGKRQPRNRPRRVNFWLTGDLKERHQHLSGWQEWSGGRATPHLRRAWRRRAPQ